MSAVKKENPILATKLENLGNELRKQVTGGKRGPDFSAILLHAKTHRLVPKIGTRVHGSEIRPLLLAELEKLEKTGKITPEQILKNADKKTISVKPGRGSFDNQLKEID